LNVVIVVAVIVVVVAVVAVAAVADTAVGCLVFGFCCLFFWGRDSVLKWL